MADPLPPPSASGSKAGSPSNKEKKQPRNRIRFSCTTCRDKKLKCNRATPCDQCIKRGIEETCIYVPYVYPKTSDRSSNGAARPRPGPNDTSLKSRLRHLEQLVQVLKSHQQDEEEQVQDLDETPEDGELDSEVGKDYPSNLADPDWRAILDQITELTRDMRLETDVSAVLTHEDVSSRQARAPALLLGDFAPLTPSQVIENLPPRSQADLLIFKFLSERDPSLMFFHVPTFLRDYEAFWQDPSQFSITWAGLLYSMMGHAALYSHRAQEPLPGEMGSPQEFMDRCSRLCAACLALDDYTKPGDFKIETLLLYFALEYLQSPGAHIGTSVLWSTIVRLAFHMGYHSDPRHNADVSVFHGEMRRRVWVIIFEVDILIAWQFGVPALISTHSFDTELPRNLNDEDFNPDTSMLPPSRPETENALMLPTLLKIRLEKVYADIAPVIYSREPAAFTKIMELDERLNAAYQSIPSPMRLKGFTQSITDPAHLVIDRYSRELLYQKCRAVLHRKYLSVARTDERFNYSRWSCLDAAMKTISIQYELHVESQPLGRLAKEKWIFNSLTTHDFLLAAMILCLELSFLLRIEAEPVEWPCGQSVTKEQLLQVLSISRSIWEQHWKESVEAFRAFYTITSMLNMATGMHLGTSPKSAGSSVGGTGGLQPMSQHPPESRDNLSSNLRHDLWGPQLQAATLFEVPTGTEKRVRAPILVSQSTAAPVETPLDAAPLLDTWGPDAVPVPSPRPVPGPGPGPGPGPSAAAASFIGSPNVEAIDWTMWDNQIQSIGAEMPEIAWTDYFHQS